jgi:hypothetical protein
MAQSASFQKIAAPRGRPGNRRRGRHDPVATDFKRGAMRRAISHKREERPLLTRHTLFKPSKAETKAESTTTVAMGIIEAETAARQAKTERLKAARLEREAAEKAPEPKARKTKPRAGKRAAS